LRFADVNKFRIKCRIAAKEKQMSRREQLIDLLVARTSATRERLERESTDELEKVLDRSLLREIHAEAQNTPEVIKRQQEIDEINADRLRMAQEQQLSLIFRTPVGKKVAVDCQSNRNIIRSWLDESQGDTAISVQWFKKVLNEQPGLARQLSWQSANILDPAKRRQVEAAQDAEERRVFHEFCVANGFSEVDANFLLVKSVLESGFDQYSLAQAVQSNALQGLAPASPNELEQFRQEVIEAHNLHLLNSDLPTLRRLAREAGARGPAVPQPDETQRVRAAERSEGNLYPPLPDEFRDGNGPEEVLNATFIKKCSKETLRLLVKRYGFDQINGLLRNRVAGSIWEV